ncbi:MAG: DUF222 domain-containing protein [Brooklawnia sp.]|jgi:hypothetical protein
MSSTLDALARIDALLDGLDHRERAGVAHTDRLRLVGDARRVAARLDALLAVLVSEAEVAGAAEVVKGTPLRSWLTASGQASSKEAGQLIFTGRDLAAQPAVREAALAGEIGVRQARSITRVLSELPANLDDSQRSAAEKIMLEAATCRSAGRLATMTSQVLDQVAPEHAEATPEGELRRRDAQRGRALQRRSLLFFPDGDGSTKFTGSLPSTEAARFIKIIDAHVESDRRQGRDHADHDAERRTVGQRQADALVALLGDHEHGRRAPAVAGDRPRVVVIMDEQSLRQRAEADGVLDSGQAVSVGELRRLCCDADLVPAVLGTQSEVLDIGRAQRLVTPGLRRALSLRDGGCVFPGCHASDARCEAHHIVPWWQGGDTAIHNLVLICPHHHQWVEPPRFWEGQPPDRWEVRLDATGLPEVVPPIRVDAERKPIPGNRPAWFSRTG